MVSPLVVARTADGRDLELLPALANRHGLITGATGTGKTVTLQVLAEAFARIGVPSFMADVKGVLAGLAAAGAASPKLTERLTRLGLPTPEFRDNPVTFWDVFGAAGHPVRATISDMGPLLLGRLLNLNDTQSGVLTRGFGAERDGFAQPRGAQVDQIRQDLAGPGGIHRSQLRATATPDGDGLPWSARVGDCQRQQLKPGLQAVFSR